MTDCHLLQSVKTQIHRGVSRSRCVEQCHNRKNFQGGKVTFPDFFPAHSTGGTLYPPAPTGDATGAEALGVHQLIWGAWKFFEEKKSPTIETKKKIHPSNKE